MSGITRICVALLFSASVQCFAAEPVDFRNFAYPFPEDESRTVDDFAWLSRNVDTKATLINGRLDLDPENPSMGPSLMLDRVQYGYLTSTKQLDAVVVLGYHSGGTANWSYVYIFNFESGSPKLMGWFRSGSRAYHGLYRLEFSYGQLAVDLLDPERRIGDCCSEGLVRTEYDFRNNSFGSVARRPESK